MKALRTLAFAFLLVGSPAAADEIDIVRPLPREIVGALRVGTIGVTVSGPAEKVMPAHDAKAAAAAASGSAKPGAYAVLPFTRMAPLMFADVLREWELTHGRSVDLSVTIYEFGTGDFGHAMLPGGTRDVIAGFVEVKDAGSGHTLGMFTVRVVNRHGGWSGMLIRGGGVREKLVAEFALESARVLAGRRSNRPKRRTATR